MSLLSEQIRKELLAIAIENKLSESVCDAFDSIADRVKGLECCDDDKCGECVECLNTTITAILDSINIDCEDIQDIGEWAERVGKEREQLRSLVKNGILKMSKIHFEKDNESFSAEAYSIKGYDGVAWWVLGWETEPDENTEWTGLENRTGRIVAVMVGDDSFFTFDPEDISPLNREDYCGICGQIGCCHDGLDRN